MNMDKSGHRPSRKTIMNHTTKLVAEQVKQREREAYLNASMGGFYSAIEIIQGMIITGKTLEDINTYCLSQIANRTISESQIREYDKKVQQNKNN